MLTAPALGYMLLSPMTPNKEEGSKQRSSSAVSRLDGKEGGDI